MSLSVMVKSRPSYFSRPPSENLTIGDVIYMGGSTGSADVEETVEIDFSINNTGAVGGFQFDIQS